MRYAVLGLVFLVAGCETPLPNSPTRHVVATPITPPPPVGTPPATGEAATLEVTTFTLGTPDVNSGWYFYYPQLELKETTGRGGATVTSLEFSEPGGERYGIVGSGCLPRSSVAPGGTWNYSAVYFYCQDVEFRTPVNTMTVTISYTDTAGHAKTVSGVSK